MTLLDSRGIVPSGEPLGTAVQFRLLGDVEVWFGDRVVDIGHARQRCVLAALLAEPDRPVPADVLIEHAWADRRPSHARTALSGYVSRLRHTLAEVGGVRLSRQGGGYILSVDPMTVDLHRFRHLVGRARAASDDHEAAALFGSALALWRGEAFATLDTPWINIVREVLSAERLAAEVERIDVELRLGRHAELLSALAELAGAHPLDERVAGQYLIALYRNGRQADALTHYQQIRRRLADELGVDPSPGLQAQYQQILTLGTAPSAPVRDAPPELLERSEALAELDESLSGGRLVLVAGEAGIGKSALVRRFMKRHDGVRFLVGMFDPLLTPRPLGPLRDIAEQTGGALARMLAEGGCREQIMSAFLDEVSGYRGPQVIVVEDAHWADEATVDWLVLLGRRLDRLRVTLVVSYRDTELGAEHRLHTMLRAVPAAKIKHVRPGPLSGAAVVELARRVGRSGAGVHAVTGGNPLLVTEMLAAGESGVPATVRDLVLARVAALSPDAREVVRFVAVNPVRVEVRVLDAVLGVGSVVVEESLTCGLLVQVGGAVCFRHELLRRAVEESLSPLRHAELDRLGRGHMSSPDGRPLGGFPFPGFVFPSSRRPV